MVVGIWSSLTLLVCVFGALMVWGPVARWLGMVLYLHDCQQHGDGIFMAL